ncbi:MAG TPA: polysaccharide deacetylase [Verrucomicrobiales bacterium]|nr:polysaccharide deacetylase [Verrucomicrobiales bacterium]
MLMYHKLGPRPARVRIKGLYVSSALFQRQLRELSAAGFHSVPIHELTHCHEPKPKSVVLTFDDGFENVLRYGLEPMRACGFQAIQFLVADLLGKTNEWEQRQGEVAERLMDEPQVREWLAAGHAIGAHTCTHPRLTQIPLKEAQEEIRASKAKLEDRFGVAIRHFCYPFGDYNQAIRDAVLSAGFDTACTTKPGLCRVDGDRLQLRRLTARYASLKWATVGQTLRRWLRR